MISIIISSADKQLLNQAVLNIETTIGVPFEILSFDNSDGARGICEIYNEGAKKAKYDVLCYMHEDLDIKTADWGKEVLRLFNEQHDLGIIGVVGSTYKTFAPSGWAAVSHQPNTVFSNYLQSFKRTDLPSVLYEVNPEKAKQVDVVCIDGMWFCTLKDVALKHPFDQELLKGFHCYDIDYCLNVGQNYRVAVTFNILMEHFSEGGYSKGWLEDTLKLQDKWEHTLPRSVATLAERDKKLLEKRAYKSILEKMGILGYSFKYMESFLRSYRRKAAIGNVLYFKLLYYGLKFISRK